MEEPLSAIDAVRAYPLAGSVLCEHWRYSADGDLRSSEQAAVARGISSLPPACATCLLEGVQAAAEISRMPVDDERHTVRRRDGEPETQYLGRTAVFEAGRRVRLLRDLPYQGRVVEQSHSSACLSKCSDALVEVLKQGDCSEPAELAEFCRLMKSVAGDARQLIDAGPDSPCGKELHRVQVSRYEQMAQIARSFGGGPARLVKEALDAARSHADPRSPCCWERERERNIRHERDRLRREGEERVEEALSREPGKRLLRRRSVR